MGCLVTVFRQSTAFGFSVSLGKEGCYRPTVQMRTLRPPRARSESASSGWVSGLDSRALSAPPSHCPPKEVQGASRGEGGEAGMG